jgi:hypothetical protein
MNDSTNSTSKWIYGGDFGASFGAGNTFINISPSVGYKINPNLTLGGGVIFQYTNESIELDTGILTGGMDEAFRYQDILYGGRVFLRSHFTEKLFFTTEGEIINLEAPETGQRYWEPAVWLGAGYTLKVSQGVGLNVMVLYNVTFQKETSPYASPLDVRFGFQL